MQSKTLCAVSTSKTNKYNKTNTNEIYTAPGILKRIGAQINKVINSIDQM